MTAATQALRIEIRGVVQGVGFRPFVFRAAGDHAIMGWVRNDSQGVCIHAEGTPDQLNAFLETLRRQPPAAARIDSVVTMPTGSEDLCDFQIVASDASMAARAGISPDLPLCGDCRRELFDPANRRYQYPYINCTACGPRYSIIRALPYDRPQTTMSAWQLCEACQREYDDPADRRYHAQPTACGQCGPNFHLLMDEEPPLRGLAAIARAASLLAAGRILALKGIGGYHLACDALNQAVVEQLRQRKFRKEKPFAVMFRELEQAHGLVHLEKPHIALLLSPPRPIVLAQSKQPLPWLAPDCYELGVMLPYAPLHDLLFQLGAPSPLVLTSANRSSEPIAFEDEDAVARLGGIADGFVIGERPIARRVDDSVVAVQDGRPSLIRRSRGYAPSVVARLPQRRPVLAVGADLKNTIALAIEGEVLVSQYIGDLGDLDTDRAFAATISDWLGMYAIRAPDLIVVHDAHPEFVSTRLALQLAAHAHLPIQHHRAHLASVLAERGELDRPVVGIALDGTGFGDDGTIWGCELFVGSVASGFHREFHLRPAALPGGDAAARFPVQAAAGFLAELDLPDLSQPPFSFPARFFQSQQLVAKNVRCYSSTSAGRLFDTVAALCGFTRETTFEGQAAMWLEYLASNVTAAPAYPFPELDYRPLLRAVVEDRCAGRSPGEISFAFHAALAKSLWEIAARLARQHSIGTCVFSGGVMQNRLLRRLLGEQAAGGRCRLLFNEVVPCNDGGVSLGQAAFGCLHP